VVEHFNALTRWTEWHLVIVGRVANNERSFNQAIEFLETVRDSVGDTSHEGSLGQARSLECDHDRTV
jgi:hypothetical protein